MSKKDIVEKERVVCQNCRYHYSFLYDAKEAKNNAAPSLEGNLENFKHPRECFRACPHCASYQDWMVGTRRKHQMMDLLLVALVGACGMLLYILYQLFVVAIDPLGTGSFEPLHHAQNVMLGYLGFVTIISGGYMTYLRWIWDPNQSVDTENYEAAIPEKIAEGNLVTSMNQYEAATRLAVEVELPRRKFVNPFAGLTVKQMSLMAVSGILGTVSLLAPAFIPELAFELARRGLTMTPFYLGVSFLMSAAFIGSWQFIEQQIRTLQNS